MSQIRVDQGGAKVEKTNSDTVIAATDDVEFSVLIPTLAKRRLTMQKRLRIKGAKIPFSFFLKQFAAGVYYAVEPMLRMDSTIVIDNEYCGHENDVKSFLLGIIRRRFAEFKPEQISFGSVDKKTDAHKICYEVFTGTRRPNRILAEEEISRLFKE